MLFRVERQVLPFGFQKFLFSPKPTTIPGQRPVRADNAVAGNDEGDLIGAVGPRDGTDGSRATNGVCNLRIAAGFTCRDHAQLVPNHFGELGPVVSKRCLKLCQRAIKERGQFQSDLTRRCRFPNAHPALGDLIQLCQFRTQRLSICKLQQMQRGLARDRNHIAQRRRNPIGKQDRVTVQATRRFAQQFCKGRTKGTGRLETGIDLSLNNFAATGNGFKPVAQPALTCHFEERHTELALKATSDGRRIKPHSFDVRFTPTIVWSFIQRS